MIILMMIELFECLLVRIVQAFSLYVKIDDFCEKMHVLVSVYLLDVIVSLQRCFNA